MSDVSWSSSSEDGEGEEAQDQLERDMEEARDRTCPTLPEYESIVFRMSAIAVINFPRLFFTEIKMVESVAVCYRDKF